MRKLTIKRAKKYVAWMSKVKVYIEDSVSGDTTINNVPCRKIGDLKNGEEKTFEIGNEAAKVFVIIDKLSRNYCNDYYEIPAGEEDVYLTGQNKYNLANGNAFVFDNNFSEQAILNRKKNKKKGLIVFIVALLVGLVFGFATTYFEESADAEKVFSAEEMKITLTGEFFDIGADGYTAAFGTGDVAVLVSKEKFEDYEGLEKNTPEEYGKLVIENNDLSGSEIVNKNELIYFTYSSVVPESEENYKYNAYIFKSKEAFWLVQFATLVEISESYSSQIEQWAKTVTFEE
ncbi:MAG: hypothetical protein IJ262_07875 [Clostridia bacterium]|nr:hypothetical protein [Clostridia bacterium]